MADDNTAQEAEIDVDALDDEAFAKLKGEMASQADETDPSEGERDEPATKVAEKKEAAPDENAEKDDDEPDEGKRSETVPHGQYHRERERRKAVEAEKERIAQNYQKLLERTQALLEAQTKPEPEQKSDEPDPSNPLEQIAWLVKEVREGRMSREEASKQAQEEGRRQEYAKQVQRVEEEFKAKTPDYEQALQFAAQSRDEELQLMYPLSTEEQRREFVLREWQQITEQALQAGVNPAERAYQFAVKRGYKKAEEQQPETVNTAKSAVEEIAEREEARKAAMSLGKTGGGVTNTGKVSPEQLLEMTDEEFAAYRAKHGSVARAFMN